MKNYFFILSIYIFLSSIFVFTIPVNAQYIPDGVQPEVYINMDPNFPPPSSEVNLSLTVSGFDISRANISWLVDGKEIKSGRGVSNITVNSGPVGKKTEIKVKISPSNSFPVEKTLIISPGEMDIVWEARTYTPPFYKGKALFSPESKLVIFAIPNIIENNTEVPYDNISYKWIKDSNVVGTNGGYGRNNMVFKSSILRKPENIRIEARTDSGSKVSGFISLSPTSVYPAIYEYNPSLGVLFNKGIKGGFLISEKDKTLVAYPFFFSTEKKSAKNMVYNWIIDNSELLTSNSQSFITIRNNNNKEGRSSLGLNILNKDIYLERSNSDFSLYFTQPQNQ